VCIDLSSTLYKTCIDNITIRVQAGAEAGAVAQEAALAALAPSQGHGAGAGAGSGLVALGVTGGAAAAPRAPGRPPPVHRAQRDVAVVRALVRTPEPFL
jgi:hypothetical protein